MTEYTSIYGRFIGPGEVRDAVIATLNRWIVYYVAEYERQRGLPPRTIPTPPTPESIHGGIDFDTWQQDLLPELIVTVAPLGEPERYDGGTYGTWWQVEVAAVAFSPDTEDAAYTQATWYAASLLGLLTEQGAFGVGADGVSSFSERTRLVSAPRIEWTERSDVRRVCRAVVPVRVFTDAIVTDTDGPRTPPTQDPYETPLPWTNVSTVEVVVEADGSPTSYAAVDSVVPPEVSFKTN